MYNLAEDYDEWMDLCSLRPNISIALLIDVVPSFKNKFEEGVTVPWTPRKAVMTARIYASLVVDDRALEIDISILDRIIPCALTNTGSGINIMLLTKIVKLGLTISSLSPYIVKVANNGPSLL